MRVAGSMINGMELGLRDSPTETLTSVNMRWGVCTARVCISGPVATHTMVSGSKAVSMGMACGTVPMVTATSGSGIRTRLTGTGCTSGPTEISMKDAGACASAMARATTFSLMETST